MQLEAHTRAQPETPSAVAPKAPGLGAIRRMAPVALFLLLGAATPAPLHVGTSGDYPPFSIVAPDGSRSGFDVDVTGQLAAALGRPFELVQFRWPELAPQSKNGAFDLVASGVTIRPERTLLGRFTRPYAVSEAVVLVRRDDEARYRSVADVDREGMHVVVNRGGYLESVARNTFKQARVETIDDNRGLDATVLSGQADALVTDSIEARYLRPMARVGTLTRDRKAIFVPARNPDDGDSRALHARIDTWLAEHNGEIEPLRRKWFKGESELDAQHLQIEAVAALLDQRCGLAPWVASAKRMVGLPIEDPERERKVLAAAAARARAAQLPEEPVVALFTVLIEASKDIQRAAAPIETNVDLDTLRGVLSDLDERLVAELAALRAQLARDGGAKEAGDTLRRDIDAMPWPGLGEARKGELTAAVAAVVSPPS